MNYSFVRFVLSSVNCVCAMAEIIQRDTHAAAIRRAHDFANSVDFPQRLVREVRTRLNYLHTVWQQFQQAHLALLQSIEDVEQRAPHIAEHEAIELLFLTTDAIMNDRIAESEQMGENPDEFDNRSEISAISRGSDVSHHNNGSHDLPQNSNAGMAQPNTLIGQYSTMLPWQFRIENIWGEFDGNAKKWQAFHDSYKARIYDDPSLRLGT